MADDSPVFSLILSGKDKWDMLLGANDLVRIKVIPDTRKGEPDNPYIMVGLISDIHKEGEYDDGILLYRITGIAMSKVLTDFEVGVIQGVATIISGLGWLPDSTEYGLQFSGSTAAEIAAQIMDRFVFTYADYSFSNGRTLEDFFDYDFISWDDESLADITPFINYQGSLRQFLEDVSAKPFNELYFEFTHDGRCLSIMRPTPFDPDKWNVLHTIRITSDVVVEESFGKSDAEMYSVFVVHPPNLMDFTALHLGVFPQHHPDLIKKYGYKLLEVENKYLLSGALLEASEQAQNTEEGQVTPPTFDEIVNFLHESGYLDKEVIRVSRSTVYNDLITAFPSISQSLADSILDSIMDGDFTRERYNDMTLSTGNESLDREIRQEKNAAEDKLEEYTKRLYNWYCENANFYSGDIRVVGDPSYRIGTIILYEDFEQGTTWEFYCESVQHEFNFETGYTTILGVTRGLPEAGKNRFSNLWGQSEEFKGGYLGEMSLEQMLEAAQPPNASDGAPDAWGSSPGGPVATRAMEIALSMLNYPSVYTWGGGRTGSNPFLSRPIKVDCSSFVWWCYFEAGVALRGGKTGMTTDTIKADTRLTTVQRWGTDKNTALSKMKKGDIVYFDTYKKDGHVGIYIGDKQFIGAQSSSGISIANMGSGYWWDKFKGHVLRYEG